MSTETEFLTAYEAIKQSYKTAMRQVEQAIEHEEAEQQAEAIKSYEESLQQIEATFAIPVGLPDEIDAVETQWNDACALIQKLKSAKTEVSYRLKVLQAKQSPIDQGAVEAQEQEQTDGQSSSKAARPLLAENPSTFYDITNSSGGRPKTYRELATGMRQLLASREASAQLDELFQAQIKLYRIESSGQVQTVSGNTKMSLIMCTVGGEWSYMNGMYFIQCDMPQKEEENQATDPSQMIWLYPLIPNVSTCYRTEYGAFILPDMESQQTGNAFGLMLVKPQRPLSTSAGETEEEQFADLQQFFLDLLEAVLADRVAELQSPRTQRAAGTSEQVSRHIVCAADFIARNLVKGAEKTGGLMMRSTPYLMSKMTPASPDAPAQVPASVQTGVEVAQKVTHAAAGVTGWIAGKVGTAAVAVGGYLAPHVQTQGSKLLQRVGYDSTQADSAMEGAMTIAAGAVEGFTTVFDGLETSAKILGTHLSQNSVKIIEHK